MQNDNSMLVLVAGPYRSGTDGEPDKLAANVQAMNEAALEVFRAGHLPVTGEALALPLIELAGEQAFDEIFHPIARRLVKRCDGVLRIGGPSAGADEMVSIARAHGKQVFMRVGDLPLMLKQERQRRILELVATDGRVVATELSARLGVSGYTVRRDLDELAGAGSLQRVHGGALSSTPAGYAERQVHALEGKIATARAAARLLHAGQTVILDGGSTALHLAEHIRSGTVITHSPPVASALAGRAEVILIGGVLDPRAMVATGAETIRAYQDIQADVCFVGVWAIDADHGLSGGYREESEVRRTLIGRAGTVVGLADASKLGTIAPFRYAPATALTHLATDATDTGAFEELGIEIVR